jgi:outer membrane immunogenic protein
MRRSLVLAAACAIVSAQVAVAADMPTKAPAYVAPASIASFNWTGFYLGGHVGYGWEQHTVTNVGTINGASFPAGTTHSADDRGMLGGFQAGYDWQFNPNWLIGVGADYAWSGIKGDSSNASTVNAGVVSSLHDEYTWLATLTGRLGYVANNWLLYGKGGAAWGHHNNNSTTANAAGVTTTIQSGGETRSGWTLGAGTEYQFARNWSAMIEYDYVNFGTKTLANSVSFGTTAPVLTGTTTLRDNKSYLNLVKVGVNYRF